MKNVTTVFLRDYPLCKKCLQNSKLYINFWTNRIKNCTTTKVIDRGKRSKMLSEVMPVENISNNQQSFLEISPVQKQALFLYELQDHTYEQ